MARRRAAKTLVFTFAPFVNQRLLALSLPPVPSPELRFMQVSQRGADALVRADPWSGSGNLQEQEVDPGVGRGPGDRPRGPPHLAERSE